MFRSRKHFTIYLWSCYLLVTVSYLYQSRIDEFRSCVITKGVIVDKYRHSAGGFGSGYYLYPGFAFVYRDSTYYSGDRTFRIYSSEIGDSLRLIFPPDRPDLARVYEFADYWIRLPAILALFVTFFFVYGLVVILKWGEGYSMFR